MKKVLLSIIVLLCALHLAAETKIGSVVSSSGTVTIDSFGSGSFIAAKKGDALYASSVVKAGQNGRATLEIQGQTAEVAAGAAVKVADLSAAGTKKSSLGWFAAVGKLIKSFGEAGSAKESDLVLGSRAAEVTDEGSGMEWAVEETDPETILPEAQKKIDAGDYVGALAKLATADPAAEAQVKWEMSFWKGFCYFQVEDYGDAVTHLADAYSLQKSAPTLGAPNDRAMLVFQLGTSYFLLGKNDAAIPLLKAYATQNPDSLYAPYASVLLARSLSASGDAAGARTVASAAAEKYKGKGLDTEFAAFVK